MILTNRLFTRRPPSREAKSIYIFCEGVKREVQYFEYFKELDSRINIEVYPLQPNEDNSPLGLYNIAEKCLIKTDENQNPKYELLENDEVWIVLDSDRDKRDSRTPQILELRTNCDHKGWLIAQSNPCFEVWLHNHFYSSIPAIKEVEKCSSWKQYLNGKSGGGFDSRRHPILINDGISNSIATYSEIERTPNPGSTSVYLLAESIYSLVAEQIEEIRERFIE
jgi:hypothetical protein